MLQRLLLLLATGHALLAAADLSALDTPPLQFAALAHFKEHCDIHNWITLHRNWCTGVQIKANAFDYNTMDTAISCEAGVISDPCTGKLVADPDGKQAAKDSA